MNVSALVQDLQKAQAEKIEILAMAADHGIAKKAWVIASQVRTRAAFKR
jgi:hypothetical protein